MKLFRKLISMVLILTMVMTSTTIVEAEEATPIMAVADTPSNWAVWNVQMASIYGLGDVDNYKQYTTGIIGSQFLTVQSSLEDKFAVLDESKVLPEQVITRGDIVNELYDIIQLALKLDTSKDGSAALDYFVENKLIFGSQGGYALEKPCTQEEMLVFSQRVYEYIVYELGLDAKGAFWEVSDEDNTVYLLGSVHATDGSVYPMSKEILQAFYKSDAVAVEANILMPNAEEMAYMQQIMMLTDGSTIDQLISKETYDAYAKVMQSFGIPAELYNILKPWAAAMTVQSLGMLDATYSASLGIDLYFLSLSYGLKPIIELEGLKFQVDMFDSFSPELQEMYLIGSMEGEDESIEAVKQIISLWKEGNMEELEKLVFAEEATTPEEKEFNEKLWELRNKNMLNKVKDMLILDNENAYFVIVGAGHMLNSDGLVQGLRDLGYTVNQIN